MRARDVLGKRIVAVRQSWLPVPWMAGGRVWQVESLVLEDGSVITSLPIQTETDTTSGLKLLKPGRKRFEP